MFVSTSHVKRQLVSSRNVCVKVSIFVPIMSLTSAKLLLRQAYRDPGGDEFYCVKFTTIASRNRKYNSVRYHCVLVAAGLLGNIQLFDVKGGKSMGCISPACGNSINDLSVHPTLPQLVAIASKDLSLHVWNIDTRVKVMQLCSRGLYGHVDELLTCDWSPDNGNRLISSGMDHYLIVWDLSTSECKHAIEMSHCFTEDLESCQG